MKSIYFATALLLTFLHPVASAVEWNVKHAFCSDKYLNYGNYKEVQQYNHCMDNAEREIREIEQREKDYREKVRREEYERNLEAQKLISNPESFL